MNKRLYTAYPAVLLAAFMFMAGFLLRGQQPGRSTHSPSTSMTENRPRMTVEIWSDVVCPFCYMGKRKFEMALDQFPEKERVQVIWKSFQLSPDIKTDPSVSIYQSLSKEKGIPEAQARQMAQYAADAARELGLDYHFDKVVVANTFRAHKLLHFAATQGKQSLLKENLLYAYFTEGKNIDDPTVLTEAAQAVGLDPESAGKAIREQDYDQAVKSDIREARQLGISGVPFFVFDRKYAISGAQDLPVFTQTLQRAFSEWQEKNP